MPWKECHVDGRASPLRGPPARRREDGGAVPRVRDLAQDRLQDLRAVQGLRPPRADRSQPTPVPARQPAAASDRDADRAAEAGVSRAGARRRSARSSRRLHPDVQSPAISTVHAVLDRHGLVTPRRRRRAPAPQGTPLSQPDAAQRPVVRRLQGRVHARRSALLLSAHHHATSPAAICSRCEALSTTQERYAFTVFERVFKEFGLPTAIRTDNGVPFACAHALFGLSKLVRLVAAARHSRSSASSPAIPSRTAATSACI